MAATIANLLSPYCLHVELQPVLHCMSLYLLTHSTSQEDGNSLAIAKLDDTDPWLTSITKLDDWRIYLKSRVRGRATHSTVENQNLWKNVLDGIDEKLRDSLERDFSNPVFVELRYLAPSLPIKQIRKMKTRRMNYLEKDEQELVDKYRRSYPFSSLLIFALGLILDRDYELIKAKWLKKVGEHKNTSNSTR